MAKLAKLLQAAAGNAGGEALNVEEVFSTYLYDGSSSAQTITNGIDLDGEGGMVWIKERSTSGSDHGIHDTERGVKNPIFTNLTDAENSYYNTNNQGITAFNSDGFTVASGSNFNDNGDTAASWTFRKAPKFFDVVTYTGTGSAQTISHNLGSVPGMIIVKATSTTENWAVYHRSLGATKALRLNLTNAQTGSDAYWNNTEPTSTQFTVGNGGHTGANGTSYVAYLFAHNDGDGEFGPDGDADIIKCGSFTGAGYGESDEFNVDLGFEPQWILFKRTDSSTGGGWFMVDNMRGWRPETSSNFQYLQAQSSAAEAESGALGIRSDGFRVRAGDGRDYIYIAIRRGPMAVPEDADDVFDIYQNESTATVPAWQHPFPVDFGVYKAASNVEDWWSSARLTQDRTLRLNTNDAEAASSASDFDYMDGWLTSTTTQTDYHSWAWRRAPSFFDVVAYTGNGTQPHNISHNLGAVPEMIWVKRRNSGSSWVVYHKGLNGGTTPEQYNLNLDTTDAEYDQKNGWHDTAPTSTQFTVGSYNNGSGNTFIAYLFASLDGVSKVGSFSHTNNTTTSVDCGFSSGARFVMIKLTDGSDSWYIWDTERGINAGTEPLLRLNTNSAQITGADWIDPLSSGFQITGPDLLTGTYIFYAIA